MSRKQLAVLFICNLVPATVGIAVIALLPVYAVKIGASEIVTGILLSLAFGALALGTLISGWLSDRYQRRKLTIMLVGAAGIPITFLMGQVGDVTLLAILTMMLWFVCGVTVTTANIVVSIYADPRTRGRTFGIIGATVGLGQILGGFSSGAIVDRWGFTALFSLVALVWIVQIVAVLFLSDPVRTQPQDKQIESTRLPLPKALWILMAAHILAAIVDNSAGLGRPLIMNELGFDATAISSALAITGFVALPLPIVAGWLSDRIGRLRLLVVCYLAVSLGALILSSATALWHFWLSPMLTTTVMSGFSVGLALVNDLASAETLATAVSRFSVTPWIAGIIGFGAAGFVIQAIGLQTTFLTMTLLPLISIALLSAVASQVRQYRAPLTSLQPKRD